MSRFSFISPVFSSLQRNIQLFYRDERGVGYIEAAFILTIASMMFTTLTAIKKAEYIRDTLQSALSQTMKEISSKTNPNYNIDNIRKILDNKLPSDIRKRVSGINVSETEKRIYGTALAAYPAPVVHFLMQTPMKITVTASTLKPRPNYDNNQDYQNLLNSMNAFTGNEEEIIEEFTRIMQGNGLAFE